jgi:hypothetical protein
MSPRRQAAPSDAEHENHRGDQIMNTLYRVDDPREPEPRYDPGLCCPNGIVDPDTLYVQSYDTQNLTRRECPTTPDLQHSECKCWQHPNSIGWRGHLGADGGPGQFDMWCENEAGISEVITATVPEPGFALGLAVCLIVIASIAVVRRWRRRL